MGGPADHCASVPWNNAEEGNCYFDWDPVGGGVFFSSEFLQDGDVVEVEVEGVGMVKNRIAYL